LWRIERTAKERIVDDKVIVISDESWAEFERYLDQIDEQEASGLPLSAEDQASRDRLCLVLERIANTKPPTVN
jgi:hypothetical protein